MGGKNITSAFALFVRKHRLRRGLTLKQAAAACGYSYSTISRLEHGVIGPTKENVERLAAAFELNEEERQYLGAIAVQQQRIAKGQDPEEGHIALWQSIIKEQEAAVPITRSYTILLVTGLLQTRDYMTQLFKLYLVGQTAIERAVEGRLARQQVLEDKEKEFRIVIHEAALRCRFASDKVHIEQLESLLPYFERANIDLRILPFSTRLTFVPFECISIYGSSSVAIETYVTELQLPDEADVNTYISAFEELRRLALQKEEAKSFLRGIIESAKSEASAHPHVSSSGILGHWDPRQQWKNYTYTMDTSPSEDEEEVD